MIAIFEKQVEYYKEVIRDTSSRSHAHVEAKACIGVLHWVISNIETWQVNEIKKPRQPKRKIVGCPACGSKTHNMENCTHADYF